MLRIFVLFFLSYFLSSVVAQNENEDNPVLNAKGLTYDSIMFVLKQKNVPFEYKYNMVTKEMTSLYPENKTTTIFKTILQEAKREKAYTEIYVLCNSIANNYLFERNHYNAKLYLDSAALYENKITDTDELGTHQYIQGVYYTNIGEEDKGYKHYYKAIEYLEVKGKKLQIMMYILYDLSIFYYYTEDVEELSRILRKMEQVDSKLNNFRSTILTNQTKSDYYQILFQKTKEKNYIDSITIYSDKAIQCFEQLDKMDKDVASLTIIESYLRASEYEGEKDNPNWTNIERFTFKAKELCPSSDTTRIIMIKNSLSLVLLHKKQYDTALNEINSSLSLLDMQVNDKYKAAYASIYEVYERIYEQKGDYTNAFKYLKLKNNAEEELNWENKLELIKNIETKYQVKEKDKEIENLAEKNAFQQRIQILSLLLIILLLISIGIIIHWFRLKRKSIADRLEITRIKKEEAELQSRLKDEQVARMELDKYEALLEVHFKELELDGKEKELNELKEVKEQLDVRIEEYGNKLTKYQENINKVRGQLDAKSSKIICSELKELIRRKLSGDAFQYVDRIDTINEAFLIHLENIVANSFSPSYLKYCICFVIDLDVRNIAECFSVEPSTIRMARYRIKQKLKLKNDDDLDMYLKKLASEIYLAES